MRSQGVCCTRVAQCGGALDTSPALVEFPALSLLPCAPSAFAVHAWCPAPALGAGHGSVRGSPSPCAGHSPRWWRVLSRELSVEIVTIHIRPWQTWPWASSCSPGAVLGGTQDLGVLQGLGVHSGVPLPWNGDDYSVPRYRVLLLGWADALSLSQWSRVAQGQLWPAGMHGPIRDPQHW